MCGLALIVGCGGANSQEQSSTPVPDEKPIALQAKQLTKEYDDNEIAADSKYKGKLLSVAGKISDISETFGTVNVSLEGHDLVTSVMCSFEESEKAKVATLKKGSEVTLVGRNEGSTAGLFVGLQRCRLP